MRLFTGLLLCSVSFLVFTFMIAGSHGHIMFRPNMKEDWIFWGLTLITGLSGIITLIRPIFAKIRKQRSDNLKSLDINVVYNSIVDKLILTNNQDVIAEIEKSASGASTGSEALITQGYYLSRLRNKNPSVFKLIETEIDSYLKYCKQHGLTIRA